MAIDPAAPRSRRALLAASIGGLAAVTAQSLGRPLATNAADGQTVVVGGEYTSSSPTYIANSSAGDAGIAIWGASPASVGIYGSSSATDGVVGEGPTGVHGYGGAVAGVRGESSAIGVHGTGTFGVVGEGEIGVHGKSPSSSGVLGEGAHGVRGVGDNIGVSGQGVSAGVAGVTGDGDGVNGNSTAGTGVRGSSQSGRGVHGETWHDIGVFGSSGTPVPSITAPAKTGVYGYSSIDAASRGVVGQSTAGQGVRGIAASGRGVHGEATSGTGVHAYATTGIALRAIGRVKLDDCAGVATITNGNIAVTVTPGCDLLTTSAVVATLMGSAGAKTTVHRVAVNTTNNTFTIYLTANSTAAVKVAWHVFG